MKQWGTLIVVYSSFWTSDLYGTEKHDTSGFVFTSYTLDGFGLFVRFVDNMKNTVFASQPKSILDI